MCTKNVICVGLWLSRVFIFSRCVYFQQVCLFSPTVFISRSVLMFAKCFIFNKRVYFIKCVYFQQLIFLMFFFCNHSGSGQYYFASESVIIGSTTCRGNTVKHYIIDCNSLCVISRGRHLRVTPH